MFNKVEFGCALAIVELGILMVAMAETSSGPRYTSYPEWELLPKGIDMEDEADNANRQRLIDEGEAGHEAMLAVVRECSDPILVSRALSVLRASSGNKEAVVKEIKSVFEKRLADETTETDMLFALSEALADMGVESDIDTLLPMLSHPVKRVRVLGAMYLGQRGGEKALEALRIAKARNPVGLELKEFEEAISRIENRLSVANSAPDQGTETISCREE